MASNTQLSPFQQALLDSVLKDYADIPKEKDIPDPFSDTFKAWVNSMMQQNSTRKIRSFKVLKRILIAAAILLLLAGTAMAIPAVRTAILDFFFHENEERIAITFDPEQATNAPKAITTAYGVVYVPQSYQLVDESRSDSAVYQLWHSNKQNILFTQYPLRHDLSNDNWWAANAKGYAHKSILLGDYQVEVIETEENYKLIWTNNEYLFTLELPYSVTEEEMQAIFASWGPRDKE